MKVKLLRRVRRKYPYIIEDGAIVALDTQTRNVVRYSKANNYILSYLYRHVGIGTALAYEERMIRRKRAGEYNKYKKIILG